MQRQTITTKDHDEIRRWAQARCGRPATVKGTGDEREAGVLRIDFPGYRGMRSLREITWDEFFDKFDREGLTFVYQEETASGNLSRFCKFVRPGSEKRPRAAARGSSTAAD